MYAQSDGTLGEFRLLGHKVSVVSLTQCERYSVKCGNWEILDFTNIQNLDPTVSRDSVFSKITHGLSPEMDITFSEIR